MDVFTNPSASAGCDTRSIFLQCITGLNSEFSSLTGFPTKAKEPSLLYTLPTINGRIIGFILFPRMLALWEMHTVSSRVWTYVTVCIFYYDNLYITVHSQWSIYVILPAIFQNNYYHTAYRPIITILPIAL